MTTETSRLRLPYLSGAQAQKHVTVNEALLMLDALVAARALDKDEPTPPGDAVDGDGYIVPAAATDDWEGWTGSFAQMEDGAWRRYLPFDGMLAWVADEGCFYVFVADDEDWRSFAGLPVGGSTGEALVKASGAEGDAAWATLTATSLSDFTEAAQDAVAAMVADSATIDVTYTDATPALAWDVKDDSITNAKLSEVSQGTVKMRRPAAGTGNPTDETLAQLKTDMAFAKADVGLGSVDNVQQLPLSYLDTDGTLAANSDSKVASQKAAKTYADAKVGGATGSTDNRLLRADGAGGKTAQATGVSADDSDNLTGIAALTMSGLLTLSGGQIAFPASQNPSASANTLDDYEEGTFTPVFSAATTPPTGVTYTNQWGVYTKVGRMVHIQANLTLSSVGSGGAGNARIEGLPFTIGDPGFSPGALTIQGSLIDLPAGQSQFVSALGRGTTTLFISASGDNIASTNLTCAAFQNSSIMIVNGCYYV